MTKQILEMERMLEEVEDFVLGRIAKERLERKNREAVSLEEAENRMGLR